MTLADDLLATARNARGIAGGLGFRPHRVYRITRYKAGDIREVAGEEETEITEGADNDQPPRVRWMTEEEIAVGSLAKGTVEIGALTPNDELDAWLRGDELSAGDERYIRLVGTQTGDLGALYRVKSFRAERPLRRMIQAEPVEQGFP